MENSCNVSGHMKVKEIRYSVKKCAICKKRCLFRIRKFVKCMACKSTIHKRCLAMARSETRDNGKPTVGTGNPDVMPNVETETKSNGAEGLQHLDLVPKNVEISGNHVWPVIAYPALSTGAVAENATTKPIKTAVDSGHLPLLRLRLMDVISRVYGPATAQIQIPLDTFMPAVSRLQLATVAPSIVPPPSALRTTSAFTETKDKPIEKIVGNNLKLVITCPAITTCSVIEARIQKTNPFRTAVASGHQPLLRLRLIEKISSVFGPTPIQIQIPRDTFMAAVSHLQHVQMAAVAPSIKPLSPLIETVTAFDCLKLVWDSLSLEKREIISNVQKHKIAPAPLVIKSKLTILDYSKLSEPWIFKKN